MNEHDPRLGDHEAEWRALDDAVEEFLIKLDSKGWDLARICDMWHQLKKAHKVEADAPCSHNQADADEARALHGGSWKPRAP